VKHILGEEIDKQANNFRILYDLDRIMDKTTRLIVDAILLVMNL